VFSRFTPRPTDEFQLDAGATGLSSMITTSSRRRFTGNFMIRYIMLSEERPFEFDPRAGVYPVTVGGANNGRIDLRLTDRPPAQPSLEGRIVDKYEATWVGMATAYRNYMQRTGGLERKTPAGGDIPLFIETLGSMWTAEHLLGFPYIRQTPLTAFDDIQSMITGLNDHGITNLNFRMRGWNNGGLFEYVPTTMRVHRNMGGGAAMRDLMAFAESRNAVVYPEVEIARIMGFGRAFNGFNHRNDLARAMNDMFAREQMYYFYMQDFMMGPMVGARNLTSPNRLSRIYDLAMRDFGRFNPHAISVASLTRGLTSDQNRRNLVNRAEAQGYVTEVLARAQEQHGRVIGEAANAFAWKYIEAALGVPLDASRFMNQSEAVPFYGMVTHGFIDTAGAPINMSGDPNYDILKAIENGSSPYFILAYQNAARLGENMMLAMRYFAVNYHTWLPEVVRIYNLLNDALAPVRYSLIENHEFLDVNLVRVTYMECRVCEDGRDGFCDECRINGRPIQSYIITDNILANVAKVTYEGGVSFILNYNDEYIMADGHMIRPMRFVKLVR
jgi:hypothetical protein